MTFNQTVDLNPINDEETILLSPEAYGNLLSLIESLQEDIIALQNQAEANLNSFSTLNIEATNGHVETLDVTNLAANVELQTTGVFTVSNGSGNPSDILTINEDGKPEWSNVSVSSALTAETAKNVAGGGVVNAITGTFVDSVTSPLFNGKATTAETAKNVAGGGTVNAVTGTFVDKVTSPVFNGNATTSTKALKADTASNLIGGSVNTIPIQSNTDETIFLPTGSVGQLLQSNGTEHTPTWMNPTGLAATNAVNIAGGDSGQLLYQSGVNATSKLLIGAANSVLVSDGANPAWQSKAPAAVEADHAAAATLADNSTLAVTLTGNVSNTAVKGTLPIGADVVVYYTSDHPDTTYGGSWILKDII